MVFTLAIAIHFLHYYASSAGSGDPLGAALAAAWRPCCLAAITTCIGLASLSVSDIAPVCQFGYAAALGSLVALVGGLGLTPALLTVMKLSPEQIHAHGAGAAFARVAHWLIDRSRRVTVVTLGVVAVTGVGLLQLHSKIDPLDFLPKDARVLADIRSIQENLTSTESIEAMVDFGDRDLSFVQKLDEVRMIEQVLQNHPAVHHTMSLGSFFPSRLPEDPVELAQLLEKVSRHEGETEYVSEDQRVWRISIRTHPDCGLSQQQCFEELSALTKDLPVTLTGIAPLLEVAQQEIFRSFWESFAMAFVIISGVMVLSLRSLKAGAVAMIPNLTPISIVFGILGWIRFPVDIGMMMTGSIALGLAVDGTFHFLVRYQNQRRKQMEPTTAARTALLRTGPPILQATLISSVGMLALTLSNFRPTMRFGFLMATILGAALIGDLVLLPCLLSLRRSSQESTAPAPHFWRGWRVRSRRLGRRHSVQNASL
ncbi:MAG: MMPL family transporter, partial [Planctomycetes bacterium]|nr:MMPL family transporter [Planctomycetota bacterium]